MSAAESLISWDQAQPLGKVPGSEWLCPTSEDLSSLGEVHRMNGSVSEDDIRILADGRDQHYELIQFPEGQYAVEIVDSETGQVRTTSPYDTKYLGIGSCSCSKIFHEPVRGARTMNESFPLPDGRWIILVARILGMITVVGASPSAVTGPGIRPSKEKFNLSVGGEFTALDRASMTVEMVQNGTEVSGSLFLSQLAGKDRYEEWNRSYISLDLDGSGQVTSISAQKRQILDNLGVALDMDIAENTGGIVRNTKITDPAAIASITAGVAEVLGWQRWTGIDLRTTTSQLYATMGKEDFNVSEGLAAR